MNLLILLAVVRNFYEESGPEIFLGKYFRPYGTANTLNNREQPPLYDGMDLIDELKTSLGKGTVYMCITF